MERGRAEKGKGHVSCEDEHIKHVAGSNMKNVKKHVSWQVRNLKNQEGNYD